MRKIVREKRIVLVLLALPLSVRRTKIVLVLGPCDSVGFQEKSPLFALRLAPAGALIRVKSTVLMGESGSVAVRVSASVLLSLTV